MTNPSSTNTVVKYVLFTGTTAVEGTDYTLGELAEIESTTRLPGHSRLVTGRKAWLDSL